MILIVDDKPENLFSLKRLLELNDFSVDTAHSGEEALKKILQRSYELLILDVQMPGMDGFEVAEALSGFSKAKNIPIIFLSAVNTNKQFITKGYVAGGVDYVTKPFDPDILILKVRTLHRLHEQNKLLSEIQTSLTAEVERRKENEQQLISILQSIPQIAFTVNSEGQLEFVNEYWYDYSSHPQQLPEFHPSDDHFARNGFSAILKESKPIIREVRIKNITTGELRHHLLNVIPIKQQDNVAKKWVGTFTDIHDQKTINELLELKVEERTQELIEKNAELEARNYELQQFASVTSHDLKEPLRKIQVFTSMLQNKIDPSDDELRGIIQKVVTSSQRMNNLIDDLLDYSRLSVNSFFECTDLQKIVTEVLNDLELIISEKHARVTFENLPTIEAIPGQMTQVFLNLIGNALKFCSTDTIPDITIKAERILERDASSEAAEAGHFVRVTVSDNGIGFDEQYLDKIFTLFQRLHAKELYEGTGIGLAITKKIIQKHNGTITAASKIGKGTSFTIVLPIKQAYVIESTEIING